MWGLPAPFPATHDHHGAVLILAFDRFDRTARDTDALIPGACALFVCDDGQLRYDLINHLRSEWRFNWTTHKWEDYESGADDDETSDRGPQVPGDLPEPSGTDRSDPSNQGDGTPGSLDT